MYVAISLSIAGIIAPLSSIAEFLNVNPAAAHAACHGFVEDSCVHFEG
jgi:hypothetical protein